MSNCEMPTCFEHNQPCAVKPHRCCECGGTIAKGEMYHALSGVWEGRGQRFKVCADCHALRAEVDRGCRYDEGTGFGELFESVFNGAEDRGWMLRFAEIVTRRGGKLPDWAEKRVAAIDAAGGVK